MGPEALPQLDEMFSTVENNLPSYTLDKETQFNSWLFQKIGEQLNHSGFMVETNVSNKEIHADVCEFWTSTPECVIYHEKGILLDDEKNSQF